MDEVAKVLEAALKDLGDAVCSEEFPGDKSRAKSDKGGKSQSHNEIKAPSPLNELVKINSLTPVPRPVRVMVFFLWY